MNSLNVTKRQGQSIGLKGDLATFLGELERYRCSVTIEGDQGAGKTRLTFMIANMLANAGLSVGFFSLEMGSRSRVIEEMRDTYILKKNQKLVLIADEAPKKINSIREAAGQFDAILIDSWTKVACPQEEFDKLRNDYPSTLFFTLFQRTSAGTVRGGTAPLFDASINIELIKMPSFKDNYAICTKNRYTETGAKFNIYTRKLVKDEPPSSKKSNKGKR